MHDRIMRNDEQVNRIFNSPDAFEPYRRTDGVKQVKRTDGRASITSRSVVPLPNWVEFLMSILFLNFQSRFSSARNPSNLS